MANDDLGTQEKRIVCQFSCGAASAVMTKMVLSQYPADRVVIVNAFIREEHEDNRRFYADCEKWFGHLMIELGSAKYGASTLEVWRRRRFMKGDRGAPCSAELKRYVLGMIAQPGDVDVIGFTVEEMDRAEALQDAFPERRYSFPLIEANLSKEDCYSIIDRAGIKLPEMYLKGYDNANCIGCPKGGQAYWQNIRHDFPERFVEIQKLQEGIGPGANFLRFRSGPREGERMSLAELPIGRGSMKGEPSFSCSFFCDLVSREITAGPISTVDSGEKCDQ